ncbi:hypothetical protein EG68_01503 [Paragonimus skrjabini miyazakii]|uniref:Uncharacterized protein n=1 Tax=Paragonimus skrjabini miyazakii TaxID=59628 RepID=A0A8S9Z617_9TREM|nr:hypothetical protein EG68_01503 [Paragonimus skrjabini miyazakii]
MLPTLSAYSSRGDVGLYSRIVKTRDWLDVRESEPRDYELCMDPIRSHHRSTYKRIGLDDTFSDKTTYMTMCADRIGLVDKVPRKRLLPYDFLMESKHLNDVPLTSKQRSYMTQFHPKTTYQEDFSKPTNVFEPTVDPASDVHINSPPTEPVDVSVARKRMLSQFTDHSTAKRKGRNKWADESVRLKTFGLQRSDLVDQIFVSKYEFRQLPRTVNKYQALVLHRNSSLTFPV